MSFFCARLSAASGEHLLGTASRVDVWLLLEYGGLWGRNAYTQSRLPREVKDTLDEVLCGVPRSRMYLVKHERDAVERPRFYVALSDEQQPALYEFPLERYEALRDLDFAAVLRGDERYAAYRSRRPLYLVCTHGQHDRCCATFSVPTYRAFKTVVGDTVWQCSHLGGDRFAPNAVCLPHGLVYGRVAPEDVPGIVQAYKDERVVLPRFRGRTCFPFPVQAADVYLRQELGLENIHALSFLRGRREDDVWTVDFVRSTDQTTHRVRVLRDPAAFHEYLSCADDRQQPVPQYRLLSHEVV